MPRRRGAQVGDSEKKMPNALGAAAQVGENGGAYAAMAYAGGE